MKDIIFSAIEDKKNEIIKELDCKMNEISKEENIAKLYYLLAQTFHNTKKQGELGVVILKEGLSNDFFKEAHVEDGVNYITFLNDDFEVSFSKGLSKVIKIKYKNSGTPPRFYSYVNESTLKLADLTEAFLNKKSFKNFKALADYNCKRYKQNPIASIMKYTQTYKKCNQELLDKIKKQQRDEEYRFIEIEQRRKEFEERQLYAKEFISSLTDLDIFKEDGWSISLFGILDEKGCISFG